VSGTVGEGGMIKARRIAHLTLETSDFDRQLDHYKRVIGLNVIHGDTNSAYLATKIGQLAVILKSGDAPRCTSLAFEIAPGTDLADAARQLTARVIAVERRTDAYPGIPALIAFSDPKGSVVELFSDGTFLKPEAVGGIGPHKLGHLAFVVDDPKKMADFYAEILGFRVSDWVDDFFVFMRCGPDHHTVNFLQGNPTKMHHLAFELRDAAHVIESCEVLGQNATTILWGPVRHGPGHNIATYHRDAAGQIVELFAELDRMPDEELGYFDPKPWHRNRPQFPMTWPKNVRRDIWGPQIPKDFL
jgi:catechol 2,3-dioxygenase-like lactoylglutathione lyase family enzyme